VAPVPLRVRVGIVTPVSEPSAAPKPAWFRRLLSISAPPASVADPASGPSQARERLLALQALDVTLPDATHTYFVEPSGEAVATLVIWHGFTNAPSQFTAVADALADAGLRVLVPRMPYHGLADVLNRELAELTMADLVTHADAVVDIASGFGDPVWVAGLSAGATLAGWVAANRSEVSRLVLAAPLVAPVGAPMPLIRLLVKFPRIVPRVYWWWDPRVKDKIVGSPYAYPGFPVPGIMPYLHLSEALFDHSVGLDHQLERTALTHNPGDFAIRKDAATSFAEDLFFHRSDVSGTACIDAELKWMHDFVDPRSPGTGSTAQVAAVFLAALGVGEPTAGGVLVPPLVELQPA
jgi:carboxylesterase